MTATPDPEPDRPTSARGRRRLPLLALGAVALVVVGGVLLYLFQPWALVTTTTVDEALPASAPGASTSAATPGASSSAPEPAASGSAAPTPAPTPTPTGPVELARGSFRSYEHETTGTASLVRVGGDTYVRLTDFATSNGPDVKVWLTKAGAGSADDAREAGYVDLGELKGNRGNQNYVVPAGTRLADYATVVIWCDRFSVAFGAAGLARV